MVAMWLASRDFGTCNTLTHSCYDEAVQLTTFSKKEKKIQQRYKNQ